MLKIIGQCKNCFYFCIYKNGVKKYIPKSKLFCQGPQPCWDTTECSEHPDFGCWNWKNRSGKKTIVIDQKTFQNQKGTLL